MNKKNSVTKYMTLYMSIGMCIGMAMSDEEIEREIKRLEEEGRKERDRLRIEREKPLTGFQ